MRFIENLLFKISILPMTGPRLLKIDPLLLVITLRFQECFEQGDALALGPGAGKPYPNPLESIDP